MTVEDALAHDIEKGTGNADDANNFPDDDDESFKPGDEQMGDAEVNQNWDDEENIKSITEGDLAEMGQSSEDAVSAANHKQSGKATPASVASRSFASQKAAAKSANESMGEAEIAEALKSNESSLDANSLLRRKEIEAD